ncbi:MAG: hypothetical protein HW416_2913 [Chloroflexi bacterium]|nr:hypothetical protein [Chloroflexota bacterium]
MWPWHWSIFPESCLSSIVDAGAFHFRVRDGNGWVHLARNTRTSLESVILRPAAEESVTPATVGRILRFAQNDMGIAYELID